jgi:hypothetical protein
MKRKIDAYRRMSGKRLFLRFLMEADGSGVLSLVNERDKRVFVLGSRAPIKALGQLMSNLAKKTHPSKQLLKDVKRLFLRFEKQTPHYDTEKLRVMQAYLDQGYTLYNAKMPSYRPYVDIDLQGILHLSVLTGGRRKRTIRRFATQEELTAYMVGKDVFDLLEEIKR